MLPHIPPLQPAQQTGEQAFFAEICSHDKETIAREYMNLQSQFNQFKSEATHRYSVYEQQLASAQQQLASAQQYITQVEAKVTRGDAELLDIAIATDVLFNGADYGEEDSTFTVDYESQGFKEKFQEIEIKFKPLSQTQREGRLMTIQSRLDKNCKLYADLEVSIKDDCLEKAAMVTIIDLHAKLGDEKKEEQRKINKLKRKQLAIEEEIKELRSGKRKTLLLKGPDVPRIQAKGSDVEDIDE